MRTRDLKVVMAIEDVLFPEPWSLNIFTSELSLRTGRSYRVGRVGKKIVGYIGLMFVEDEAHITTIAVVKDRQGQGIASLLLLDGIASAQASGTKHLSLEVASKNERAQALYRRFGFAPVGVRKNYYPVTNEDAYVMWAYDIDSHSYRERLAAIDAEVRSRP